MIFALVGLTMVQGANIPMPSLRSTRMTSNSLNANGENKYYQLRDWVKIAEAPEPIVNEALGARVELECEAVGSPAPTIQWLKGTNPITEVRLIWDTILTNIESYC